jgi:hypothetical protein
MNCQPVLRSSILLQKPIVEKLNQKFPELCGAYMILHRFGKRPPLYPALGQMNPPHITELCVFFFFKYRNVNLKLYKIKLDFKI